MVGINYKINLITYFLAHILNMTGWKSIHMKMQLNTDYVFKILIEAVQ